MDALRPGVVNLTAMAAVRHRPVAVAAFLCLAFSCGAGTPTLDPDAGAPVPGEEAPWEGSRTSPVPTAELPDGGFAEVHFVGRFEESAPGVIRFGFPGSEIETRFSGTGISADLELGGGFAAFDVLVDGIARAPVVLKPGAAKYVLAGELPPGEHPLRLIKRTSTTGSFVAFRGFTVEGGALVPTHRARSRLIEFVGDSITTGWGNLLPNGSGQCSTWTAMESESLAWGAVAARALEADHVAVAIPGRGVYRNQGGSTTGTMPQVWTQARPGSAVPPWDTSRLTPDVVVINLGTNDFKAGDPGPAFNSAYRAFLQEVRAAYPGAEIVCALGTTMTGTRLSQARTRIRAVVDGVTAGGDSRVGFFEMPPQNCALDGCGCATHPSHKTHEKMGAALAAYLRTRLGW